MEGAFKKRKGVLLEQSNDSNHTYTFLPAGKNQPTIISKIDIGNTDETTDKPCCSKEATGQLWQQISEVAKQRELPNTCTSDQPIETEPTIASNEEVPSKAMMTTKQQKKASAIKVLRRKIKSAKDRRAQKQQPPTIFEVETGNEEKDKLQAPQQVEKNKEPQQEPTTLPEASNQSQMVERSKLAKRSKLAERSKLANQIKPPEQGIPPRRGARIRPRTEFFGHNAMISQIMSPNVRDDKEKNANNDEEIMMNQAE